MEVWEITGGRPLSGSVAASGSKNAALPILAACLLVDGPVLLDRVPAVSDVATLLRLLGTLGARVARVRPRCWQIECPPVGPYLANYPLVRRMRASVCVLGPLLARRGRAVVALPGGCRLGDRPIDLHLAGLRALGAEINLERGYVVARAKRLRGATIDLRGACGPTVTGTANVMCAATLADGETILHGAAREVEVVDLGKFLLAQGARITGLGTSTLRIEGVPRLTAAPHCVVPDRIEAATLLLAGAITAGQVTVTNIVPGHLQSVLRVLKTSGARIEVGASQVCLTAPTCLRAADFTAQPYPDLPTDVQPLWVALMTQAAGTSLVCDRVFPERFTHLAELTRLGACVERRGSQAIVRGPRPLVAAAVRGADLRAAAGLVLAGLASHGTTRLEHAHHLARGYQHLAETLRSLGALITRPREELGRPRVARSRDRRIGQPSRV